MTISFNDHGDRSTVILLPTALTAWLLAGRESIRQWENECAQCRLQKARPAEQQMAPLAKARLQLPLRAFARTAVDFGGPYETIQGRGRRRGMDYNPSTRVVPPNIIPCAEGARDDMRYGTTRVQVRYNAFIPYHPRCV